MDKRETVLQQLKERKSVRAFEDRPIPDGVREQILASALEAPTAGNMLLYTILDIRDQGMKDQLAVLCDDQPFIAKAPMVLIFTADCGKWYDTFKAGGLDPRTPGVGDLFLAFSDALIAAHNTVVAAHSLGIGSCYIGDILENRRRVRELLRLPDYVVPGCMLVYGYPTEQQGSRVKPERSDIRHIVHVDGYRHMEADELLAMYGERNSSETLEQFCNRKYMSDFAREMTRSMEEYLERFTGRG